MADKNKGGTEEFISGIAFTLLFGFLYVRGGSWIWLFPMVIVGVIPLIRGVQHYLERRSRENKKLRRKPEDERTEREKELLRLAKSEQGILTPTVVALHTSLSLQEAEQLLGELSSRGYARVEVDEEGNLRYYFPDFLPETSES